MARCPQDQVCFEVGLVQPGKRCGLFGRTTRTGEEPSQVDGLWVGVGEQRGLPGPL